GISDAASLAAATDKLVQQIAANNGLTQTGAPRSLQVGGQPASARDLRGTSAVAANGTPQPEHDWLVTVARPDGDLDFLIFVAPESDFATLQPLFNSMLASFKPE
ncbi:MAG TPA: hypothetical protein VM865_02150, partial [Acidobacteriaceae bacterium]|nr:hypothetical protein [Acidobacteriaceae bacterium]